MTIFAVRLHFPDDTQTIEHHPDQQAARDRCTEIMGGWAILDYPQNPNRISMLVRDGADYGVVWSRDL